jgi:hypothetical protein
MHQSICVTFPMDECSWSYDFLKCRKLAKTQTVPGGTIFAQSCEHKKSHMDDTYIRSSTGIISHVIYLHADLVLFT